VAVEIARLARPPGVVRDALALFARSREAAELDGAFVEASPLFLQALADALAVGACELADLGGGPLAEFVAGLLVPGGALLRSGLADALAHAVNADEEARVRDRPHAFAARLDVLVGAPLRSVLAGAGATAARCASSIAAARR